MPPSRTRTAAMSFEGPSGSAAVAGLSRGSRKVATEGRQRAAATVVVGHLRRAGKQESANLKNSTLGSTPVSCVALAAVATLLVSRRSEAGGKVTPVIHWCCSHIQVAGRRRRSNRTAASPQMDACARQCGARARMARSHRAVRPQSCRVVRWTIAEVSNPFPGRQEGCTLINGFHQGEWIRHLFHLEYFALRAQFGPIYHLGQYIMHCPSCTAHLVCTAR